MGRRGYVKVLLVASGLLTLLVLSTVPKVRGLVSAPLVTHEPDARGDACYVLAGGGAIWERLDAAADLVQRGRVKRLMVMQDNARGPFSFKASRVWTRTEWITDYLHWRGVPD